jgi:hypothetical protein
MKRLVALLVVALTFAAGSTSALADGTGPFYEARGLGCGVIDRDGSFVFTIESYLVWRQSGQVYLRCEANGTPGSTIATFKNFGCGLAQFGFTTDSINVVRRAGRIQLECWGYRDPATARISSASADGVLGAS